jgi:hypothetical protein
VLPLPTRTRQAQAAGAARFNLFGRGALGGAIAAGVAVVSIFVMREMAPTGDASGVLLAQDSPELASAPLDAVGADSRERAPGSYITPGENSPAQPRLLDASLGHFLVAHSEEAASAFRSTFDQVAGGVEMTEDQFSALR